jgi:hypothetical protein
LTAFCITAPPALFHVDRAVFDAWIADRANDLDDDVPVAGSHPAAALEALVDEAQMLGPLRGDPRVELALTTADDHRGSGYMVVVRDRRTPGHLGLTNGWTEMSYPATDTSPRTPFSSTSPRSVKKPTDSSRPRNSPASRSP